MTVDWNLIGRRDSPHETERPNGSAEIGCYTVLRRLQVALRRCINQLLHPRDYPRRGFSGYSQWLYAGHCLIGLHPDASRCSGYKVKFKVKRLSHPAYQDKHDRYRERYNNR